MRRLWLDRLADGWTLLLALWLLAPQARSGYGLGHDMVFTPHQPLNDDSFGLGSAAPRAVPLDALVALASKVLDGAVIGRIALLLPLLLAGWGCRRLLRARSLPAQLVVSGFAVWNPYVIERLALGQWALLWAYGALPWLVRAAVRGTTDRETADRGTTDLETADRGGANRGTAGWAAAGGRTAALLSWLAVAAITPTGAVIGAACAVVLGLSRAAGSLRRNVALVGACLLVQLPWLVPSLVSAAAATSDPRAVAAFAARAERPGGAVASLLGLGGIWSSEVTPASRSGVLGYLSTAAVLLALVAGWPVLRPHLGRTLTRLGWLAVSGLVLASLADLPGLAGVLRWAVRVLPGAGLLRDGQKWLMPFVLLAVLAVGAAIERAWTELTARPPEPGPGGRRVSRWTPLAGTLALTLPALCLPVLLLPDGPATLRAPLTPVQYPAQWQAVAARVAGSRSDVLVLPFASYRAFDWAPGRSVLDPAPRWLAAGTVVQDRLAVSGVLLAGEDRRARAIGALLDPAPGPQSTPPTRPGPAEPLAAALAGAGVGWVLVELGTPGPALPLLASLRLVLDGPALRLYQVPDARPSGAYRVSSGGRALVLSVDLLVALAIVLSVGIGAARARRSLLHSGTTSISEDSSWAS